MRAVTCPGFAAALILAALPCPAAGQDSTLVKLKCDANPGGTVRGSFVDAEGTPILNARAIISLDCSASTDGLGRFEIAHIPPGHYRLFLSRPGYRDYPPQEVAVAADSVITLDLRLQVENAVRDCEKKPACAATLHPDSAGVAALTSGQRLTYAVWRTAFALTGWTAEPAVDWLPCLEEPDSAVRRALLRRFGPLAPPAQCRLDPKAGRPRARVVYLPTGRPARVIEIGRYALAGDSIEAHLSYVAGGLWAVWWDCRFRRQGGDWVPEWCRIEAVS